MNEIDWINTIFLWMIFRLLRKFLDNWCMQLLKVNIISKIQV